MTVTPVKDVTEFTAEMLAKNFVSIDKAFVSIEDWVSHLEKHVVDLYGRVDRLSGLDIALGNLETRIDGLTPAKKYMKGRKGRFVLGVAVGIAVAPVARRQLKKAFTDFEKFINDKADAINAAKAKLEAKTEQKPSTTA